MKSIPIGRKTDTDREKGGLTALFLWENRDKTEIMCYTENNFVRKGKEKKEKHYESGI